MVTPNLAKRAVPLILIAALALVVAVGCSGLTSAGLPATQSHSTKGGGGGGGTTNGGQSGTTQAVVSSTLLNFGDVAVGDTATQKVEITNNGSADVTVSENAASGAGFAASGVGSGLILAPAQSATLEVTFTPSSTGQASGTVPLVSDAWGTPLVIALSGTGIQPAAHVANLAWDPSSSVVAGYNAYRSTKSGGPYTKLNASLLPTPAYADTTVSGGQIYFYVVTAVDFSNAESGYSNEVSASVP